MSIDQMPLPAFIQHAQTAMPPAPTSITIHPKPSGDAAASSGDKPFFSSAAGPSFSDIIDIINPLQHIPIISTIYQKLTGDTASPASNVLGGLLFGGPIGLIASIANEVVSQTTGSNIGEKIVATVTGGNSNTALASKAAATYQTAQNNANEAVLSVFEPETHGVSILN